MVWILAGCVIVIGQALWNLSQYERVQRLERRIGELENEHDRRM